MKRILLAALTTLVLLHVDAQSIYTPYDFTNLAGVAGGAGNNDGVGSDARFNYPFDVKIDVSGNLYVADEFNQTIRKLTLAEGKWIVTTLAGSPRSPGSVDGTNSTARFNNPAGIAVDAAGNIYVAEQANDIIRRVTPAGVVTTLAGTALQSGSRDATNSVARFLFPSGLAVDGATNIFVADSGNYTIRKITPKGTNWIVTTIAGTAGQTGSFDGTNGTTKFGAFVNGPSGITVDDSGSVYVADVGNCTIRKITSVGTNWVTTTIAGSAGQYGFQNGTNSSARFYNPYGITVDNVGNLYVADGDFLVRKITPMGTNWAVTTLAGDMMLGDRDGTGSGAEFGTLGGLIVDPVGDIYVADQANSTIRRIDANTAVTTIAGYPSHRGATNGVAETSRFYLPFGVAVDTVSNVYVGDQGNNVIRRITPDGMVTTIAGDFTIAGNQDGTNTHALFQQPSNLAVDAAGNVYVADAGNNRVRRVSPVGTNWVVTTLAGATYGNKDGTNKVAQFRSCYGLAIGPGGNLYVADTYNHTIRRVSHEGTNWVVTTLAGSAPNPGSQDGTNKTAQFFFPYALTVDAATNIYVADSQNMAIRKVSPVGTNWVTTTIAGLLQYFGNADGTNSTARFLFPQGITIDNAGNLYVSDGGNAAIRRIVHSGTNWIVTTLGGGLRNDGAGEAGAVDGIGSTARLNNPWGLTVDLQGNLFIADSAENRIVEASPLFLFDPTVTKVTNGAFQFRLTGPPGTNAVVEASTDLRTWVPVRTNVLSAIGLNDSVSGSNSLEFLRARLMP